MTAAIRVPLAILACAIISGCAVANKGHVAPMDVNDMDVNDDPTIRVDTSAAIARLQQTLEAHTLHSMYIYHVSSDKYFPIGVSSMMLERVFDHCLINRWLNHSSLPVDFLQALQQARPSPADQVADLRWGCVFCLEDRSRILSVYFDEKGERGVINGACYTFGSAALSNWAESVCPQWVK
jgi:hypothetical protein